MLEDLHTTTDGPKGNSLEPYTSSKVGRQPVRWRDAFDTLKKIIPQNRGGGGGRSEWVRLRKVFAYSYSIWRDRGLRT